MQADGVTRVFDGVTRVVDGVTRMTPRNGDTGKKSLTLNVVPNTGMVTVGRQWTGGTEVRTPGDTEPGILDWGQDTIASDGWWAAVTAAERQ